MSYNFSNCSI